MNIKAIIDNYENQVADIRKLRANVYGEIPDASWEKVKENWCKPENQKWLREQPQNAKTS